MAGPTPEQLARYANAFNQSLALQMFGATLSFPESERVLCEVSAIKSHHRGGLGTSAVNGGVIAGLFDLAIGCCAALVDPTRRTATIQLSVQFMKPVLGDRLTVEGRVESHSRILIHARAWLSDEKGEVCAVSQGIARMSKDPWPDDGSRFFEMGTSRS